MTLSKIIAWLKSHKTKANIKISHAKHSTIYATVNAPEIQNVYNRPPFEIDKEWLHKLFCKFYDTEVQSKYVPEIHQTNDFEVRHLIEILDFENWKKQCSNQLTYVNSALNDFTLAYERFINQMQSEAIEINFSIPFAKDFEKVYNTSSEIRSKLITYISALSNPGYRSLEVIKNVQDEIAELQDSRNLSTSKWSEFLAKEPSSLKTLDRLNRNYSRFFSLYSDAYENIDKLKTNQNFKIISGNAGTGKSHHAAHIAKKATDNGDFCIYLKATQFNGRGAQLENSLLAILEIPPGYNLKEILQKLNHFASVQEKRCFIIIDGLNETTDTSIGFSNIWKQCLPALLQDLKTYTNLYLVCTLRTSYIKQIWSNDAPRIIELRGIDFAEDVLSMCQKYFKYYNIEVTNLSLNHAYYFRTPLLLDLFCKFVNGTRSNTVTIHLNLRSYRSIFRNYVERLVQETQSELRLLKTKPIWKGLNKASKTFYDNLIAEISTDEFMDSFDPDDFTTIDNSVSKRILEGYLLYIRDINTHGLEIIKHTYQEVGGFLIAKHLTESFEDLNSLSKDPEFIKRIIGDNPDYFHQLKLDILKFLILEHPQILKYLKNPEDIKLAWWYFFNGYEYEDDSITKYIFDHSKSDDIIRTALRESNPLWLETASKGNFLFVKELLLGIEIWKLDNIWSQFVYDNGFSFLNFLQQEIDSLKNETQNDNERAYLVANISAFILTTTIRNLRDLATKYLLVFGLKNPNELISIAKSFAKSRDPYIYERLVCVCYGVAMNLQHEKTFVEQYLPTFAQTFYELHLAENASQPTYNYIILDSAKHLSELALGKKSFSLTAKEKIRLMRFKFDAPFIWGEPNQEIKEVIQSSSYMSYPDPIGMDFGIYTIPRLLPYRNKNERKAIANIYKRVLELGYLPQENMEFNDEKHRNFYWGSRISGIESKIDRIGKKYSWLAFFDYAGFLLSKNKLNVFIKGEGAQKHYERLGDVDIDISNPNQDFYYSIRFHSGELMPGTEQKKDWYKTILIDSITPSFKLTHNGNDFIMLHGLVEQRIDEEYKVRSYILVETFFVRKEPTLDRLKQSISDHFFEWEQDVYFAPDRIRHIYFGELYWRSNVCEREIEMISIPTGEKKARKRKPSQFNWHEDDFLKINAENTKEVEEEYFSSIQIESQPTLLEFLWESNSNIFPSMGEYFPSVRMGKSLGLQAHPLKGKILDNNGSEASINVNYEEDFITNKGCFMREDLLNEYMSANNLSLVYQVKQHSYDADNYHFRKMKFYIR